jgi:hypothetical protein
VGDKEITSSRAGRITNAVLVFLVCTLFMPLPAAPACVRVRVCARVCMCVRVYVCLCMCTRAYPDQVRQLQRRLSRAARQPRGTHSEKYSL